ncbi:MAG: nitroreductase family protein [Elusimicrobia bacterium]|nr:nitroreductase family protein [Elusimicrobiota bacterium]
MKELTTKQAILARRSIRRYKPDPVPEEHLTQLLEAARLAPSGSNSQPWRFKIVQDPATKAKLMAVANDQPFIGAAPVVLVCCVDIKAYAAGTIATIDAMRADGQLPAPMAESIRRRTQDLVDGPRDLAARGIAFNMGIAGEHIALRALDFGLGTCWVRAFDEARVRELFGWDENLHVAALIPVGYPDESPKARPRRPLDELILP